MCGFCGVLRLDGGEPADLATLTAMVSTIEHRGPDDQGFLVDGPVGLANCRLAILDLRPEAALPMTRGPLTLAYNGEFYDFQEARDDLIARGHTFTTTGDTEVILALYREYGDAFVDHLSGMYAFALWDAERQRLLVGRDPAGKKPLYWWQGDRLVVFGSEIKAILAHPAVRRVPRPDLLPLVLAYGYAPTPETCFEGIEAVPPGLLMVASDGGLTPLRSFGLRLEATDEGSTEVGDWSARLLDTLRGAVRRRLVSDVPLGAFLSGGVDSSLLVALMQQESNQTVRTFSIGFEGDQTWDETRFAQRVADQLGTQHEPFVVTPPDIPELLPELVWHLDQPFGDSSVVPTLLLSRATRQRVTVALSGDAGDELFAGYRRFEAARRAHALRWARPFFGAATRVLRGRAQGTDYANRNRELYEVADGARRPLPDAYFRWVRIASDEALATLAPDGAWANPADHFRRYFQADDQRTWVSRLLDVNYRTYLLDDLLVKADRMTMAASLEVRSPFLDPSVVALASAMPTSVKLRGGVTKHVLKEAARPLLPEGIVDRRKHGFGVPVGGWFRSSLREYGQDLLLSAQTRDRGLFSSAGLRQVWEEHQRGHRDHGHLLWTLCTVELWYRQFIDAAVVERP
ncbi:MAG: asparagine synthase (glutamine-hydrolyzing) [Armatimonadetes bacterium]|nr:asparagine synthase (glutamine-hydrolyzing) [Armatimonadota bacterium]